MLLLSCSYSKPLISARLTERLANGAVPVRSVLSVGVGRGIDYGIPAVRPEPKADTSKPYPLGRPGLFLFYCELPVGRFVFFATRSHSRHQTFGPPTANDRTEGLFPPCPDFWLWSALKLLQSFWLRMSSNVR